MNKQNEKYAKYYGGGGGMAAVKKNKMNIYGAKYRRGKKKREKNCIKNGGKLHLFGYQQISLGA